MSERIAKYLRGVVEMPIHHELLRRDFDEQEIWDALRQGWLSPSEEIHTYNVHREKLPETLEELTTKLTRAFGSAEILHHSAGRVYVYTGEKQGITVQVLGRGRIYG